MNKGTALITGGAKRIGLELAKRLANEEYTIALHYNSSKEEAEKALHEIQTIQPASMLYQSDLLDSDSVEKLIPEVVKNHPDLQILINNASIYEQLPIKDSTIEVLHRDMALHYTAPFLLIREFSKVVKKGVVINFLDARLKKNSTGNASYFISKKALMNLTELAALELAPNIRVNAIAPGLMLPPENKPEDYAEESAITIPLGRLPSMKEITDSVLFLIENEYLTGQILYLDGGKNI